MAELDMAILNRRDCDMCSKFTKWLNWLNCTLSSFTKLAVICAVSSKMAELGIFIRHGTDVGILSVTDRTVTWSVKFTKWLNSSACLPCAGAV